MKDGEKLILGETIKLVGETLVNCEGDVSDPKKVLECAVYSALSHDYNTILPDNDKVRKGIKLIQEGLRERYGVYKEISYDVETKRRVVEFRRKQPVNNK